MPSFTSSLIVSVTSFAVLAGCGDTKREENTGTRDIDGVVLLDNGEDGNNTTAADPDIPWVGYWYTFDDKHECDNENPIGITTPLPSPDGGGEFVMSAYDATNPAPTLEGAQTENKYGVRFFGGGQTLWGSGVGVAFNNQGSPLPFDLSALGFQGLRFYIRNAGPTPVNIDVQITDGWSEKDHGWCEPRDETTCSKQGCFNAALKGVPMVGTEWQLVQIPFTDLMRGNWGVYKAGMEAPTGVDLATAYQLQFKVGTVESFDIWIDNVGLY